MATASMGAQGAGAAMSAVGSYFGARSQQIALRGAADIQDINADQTELSAQQELARGNAQVAQVTRRAGQIKGAQRAALGKNGVDLGDGNAAEVLASTDLMKEEDVNTITANAVRSAWGQRVIETNQRSDARSKRAGADSISPFMAAATSLLGSASQISSNWYSMNKSGAMPKAGG